MKNLIDNTYFQELVARDPEEVCRRARCKYNQENRSYIITVWGDDYVISPQEGRIECLKKNIQNPHEFFYLFIVYYLLKSKGGEEAGEWISEKDIPGGPTFFRGPHEIPTRLISKRYGNDINAFKKRCTELQGTALEMGDAAYRFEITSNIPAVVLYWMGDDEFPPEAQLMYDKSISGHLTPDIVFALAVEICTRIGGDTFKSA